MSDKNTQTIERQEPWYKKHSDKLILLAVILIIVIVCITVPSVNAWVKKVFYMFRTGDFDTMHDFIADYGPYAMAVSFFLMIFQSVIAPLPAFFITLANANLFGWWQGAILSWSSAMAGAALCFYIARILGRDAVEKLTSRTALKKIDDFFDRYGKRSILIARLLPFISFDIVSYAAGLTPMGFWDFFIATGIGQLPATIVYSYVGGMLTGGARMLFFGLTMLFALAILIALARQIWTNKQDKKEEPASESAEK